jgi:hypothetical protein
VENTIVEVRDGERNVFDEAIYTIEDGKRGGLYSPMFRRFFSRELSEAAEDSPQGKVIIDHRWQHLPVEDRPRVLVADVLAAMENEPVPGENLMMIVKLVKAVAAANTAARGENIDEVL